MEPYNVNNFKYLQAKNRVKRIKGLYIHALVYLVVNIFIIAKNISGGKDFESIDNYYTAIFWGIGLLVHAMTVFVPNFILGSDWEERKIKELMNNKNY